MGVGNSKFEVGKRYYAKDRMHMDFIIFDAWDDEAGRNVVMTFFPSGGGREPHIFHEDLGSSRWYGRFLEGREDDKYQDTPPAEEPEVGETWMRGDDKITAEYEFYMMRDGLMVKHLLLTVAYGDGGNSIAPVVRASQVFDLFPRDKD